MATAKQIAWRKEFAKMAKAGTLRQNPRSSPKTIEEGIEKAIKNLANQIYYGVHYDGLPFKQSEAISISRSTLGPVSIKKL